MTAGPARTPAVVPVLALAFASRVARAAGAGHGRPVDAGDAEALDGESKSKGDGNPESAA